MTGTQLKKKAIEACVGVGQGGEAGIDGSSMILWVGLRTRGCRAFAEDTGAAAAYQLITENTRC